MKRFSLFIFLFLWVEYSIAQQVIPVDIKLPKVLFTNPDLIHAREKDKILLKTMEDLIMSTPKGEEITVSIFKFNRKDIAETLVEAQNRGVKVRVIMNKGETSKKDNKDIKDYFKENLEDFYYIENTISEKAIIHNKFILFSGIMTQSGLLHNVVLQTSSNIQKKSSQKLQDMLIFQDEDIYYGYLDFWYNIKVLGNVEKLESYNYYNIENDGYDLKAFFFPKRKNEEEKGQDNIIKILSKIKDPEKACIRFAHGKWNDDRDNVLAVLKTLSEKGAEINIITNKNVDDDLFNSFDQDKVSITFLPDHMNMHTKFFLTDADFGNGQKQIAWTGSHNMTERSLRNNFEVLLAIQNPEIYEDYLKYFEEIRDMD
ncbi:phospholipase D-like domain-containing protein [Bacteroidota bacterium]